MPKRRILFLFNKFPYPVIGGDKIKVVNIGKILAKYFAVDLVCIDEGGRAREKLSIQPFENIFCFHYPRFRFRLNALLGITDSLPLQTHYYNFSQVNKFVNDILGDYDLAFCHLLRMAPYLTHKRIPKIIDLADSLALTYEKFYDYAKGIWKLLYKIDAVRLARYEVETVSYFDRALLVNEEEKDLLVSRGAVPEKIKVITNGVNEELLLRENTAQENNEIIFFARLAAFHNEDAAVYFAREVWPLIWQERKDTKFVIIGACPTEKILRLKNLAGVEVCGYLADPYARILKAKLCVFPMRVAQGVQNKILEVMALGKAVVVTPVAVEAIKGEDGTHFVVGKDKQDLSQKIAALLANRQLRQRLGLQARQLIQEQYLWSHYEKKLLPEIEKLLKC